MLLSWDKDEGVCWGGQGGIKQKNKIDGKEMENTAKTWKVLKLEKKAMDKLWPAIEDYITH